MPKPWWVLQLMVARKGRDEIQASHTGFIIRKLGLDFSLFPIQSAYFLLGKIFWKMIRPSLFLLQFWWHSVSFLVTFESHSGNCDFNLNSTKAFITSNLLNLIFIQLIFPLILTSVNKRSSITIIIKTFER